MARHTIVIEVPDWLEAERAEQNVRSAIRLTAFSRKGQRLQPIKIVEYHYEQMTTTEESP